MPDLIKEANDRIILPRQATSALKMWQAMAVPGSSHWAKSKREKIADKVAREQLIHKEVDRHAEALPDSQATGAPRFRG